MPSFLQNDVTLIENQNGMIAEYIGIFLKVILSLKTPSEVQLRTSKLNWKKLTWETGPEKNTLSRLNLQHPDTVLKHGASGQNHSPVSILRHLPPGPKTIGKPLNIASWPECQPEFPNDADGDGDDTRRQFFHLARPIVHSVQG